MKVITRSAPLACAILGLSLVSAATPALAATHHKHHRPHHHHVAHKKNSASTMIRTAQMHLKKLRYYTGSIDGLSGPKMTLAIKNFQLDHHFKITGKLDTRTYNAIVAADIPNIRTMVDTMPTVSSSISTRYSKVDVRENQKGSLRSYEIAPGGSRLFTVVNQPSPMDTSPVFQLPNEDAVIFSAYRMNNSLCPYTSYLLVIDAQQSRLLEIDNCTRGYHAEVNNDSLIVTFPESEDGGPIGSTWRYENGHLEKL